MWERRGEHHMKLERKPVELGQRRVSRGGRQKPGNENLVGCVEDSRRRESYGGGCVLPSLLHCKLPKTQDLYQTGTE